MHESELALLLEGTADAAFAVDLNGQIRAWNHAAERMFGCDASSACQRPCSTVINGHGAGGTRVCRVNCSTLERARRALAAPRGRAHDHHIANFDLEARPSNRAPFWVNVSLLVVDDPDARRRRVVHFVRDIADRKRAEQLAAKVVGLVRGSAYGKDTADLSPTLPVTAQERRILELLREGNGTKEMARKLGISLGTLRNHIHHLDRKLGTHGRLQAVMQAVKRGLI